MTSNEAADRLEIFELLNRYGFAIDDKDWEALGEVFCHDCTADYGKFGSFEGATAVVDWMAPAHVGLTTQHAMANMVVKVDGDTATARSYVTVTLQPTGAKMFRAGGQYHDTLEKRDGRWQIKTRLYTTIWEQNPAV